MLSRTSKIPLYHQLYEIIRTEILTGDLEPGDMLPTENDLLTRYSVSRNTVRQALDALVSDGLIERHRGRGTFVSRPPIEQGLSRIVSFTEDMRARGLEPGTEVLASEIIPAPESIARALKIETGTELAHLKRLRLADGEPMSLEHSYLVHRHCPGVLERNYSSSPLRETLERDYGIRLTRAEQTIRAAAAGGDTAHTLGVDPGAPLLTIERTTYSDTGAAVEYLRILHRGDRYALYTELRDD